MRRLFCLCAVLTALCAASAHAASPREEILADKNLSAANYRVYPAPDSIAAVNVPDGYTPCYISSYARHGSRFLMSDNEYDNALKPLERADSAGILTAEGRRVLDCLRRVKAMSQGRTGELTDVGAAQHRGIARRLYKAFPEVYDGSPVITARSTVVIRCIMSMMAECLELQSLSPGITFVHDASEANMPRMNDYHNHWRLADRYNAMCDSAIAATKDAAATDRLFGVLFSDPVRAKKNIAAPARLIYDIFYVGSNMQSHSEPDLGYMDLFTPEECFELWKVNNTDWYFQGGNTPLTGNVMPFSQLKLYKDILDDGDAAAAGAANGATMRFGHESVVLPTAVFFELDDAGYSTTDLAALHDRWGAYRYFPMASNIQFVFYRRPGSDVLVRVLLNERDAALPVAEAAPHFYRWADVSSYFRNKIARYEASEAKGAK